MKTLIFRYLLILVTIYSSCVISYAQGILIYKTDGSKIDVPSSEMDSIIVYSDENPVDSYNGQDYVDMGLSVKWATCNIGATRQELCGDYFAWGELNMKSDYNWSTYKWGSAYNSLTKYCVSTNYGKVDNKENLDIDDDVARNKWGGKWRLPTKKEIDELMDKENCLWVWTTKNGKKGYKIMSKKTSKSIFLPATGCRGGNAIYDLDLYGGYWSSTIDKDFGCNAIYLNFQSGYYNWGSYGRYAGRTIRAVCP